MNLTSAKKGTWGWLKSISTGKIHHSRYYKRRIAGWSGWVVTNHSAGKDHWSWQFPASTVEMLLCWWFLFWLIFGCCFFFLVLVSYPSPSKGWVKERFWTIWGRAGVIKDELIELTWPFSKVFHLSLNMEIFWSKLVMRNPYRMQSLGELQVEGFPLGTPERSRLLGGSSHPKL